jgi:hypothetical protein
MDREGLDQVISHLRQPALLESQQTDRLLLESYLARRDEAAFTALVQRHGPMIYGLALRLLHDAHAAEDVFHATFFILASKAHTIRRQNSVSSWLYGVAHRLAVAPGERETKVPRSPRFQALMTAASRPSASRRQRSSSRVPNGFCKYVTVSCCTPRRSSVLSL